MKTKQKTKKVGVQERLYEKTIGEYIKVLKF